MTRKRADARAKLTCEQKMGAFVAEILRRAPNKSGDWEKYRRLLLALLRERADAAAGVLLDRCESLGQVSDERPLREAIRRAVTNRGR